MGTNSSQRETRGSVAGLGVRRQDGELLSGEVSSGSHGQGRLTETNLEGPQSRPEHSKRNSEDVGRLF